MHPKKLATAGAMAAALTSTLMFAAAAPASANDDTRRVAGDCSNSSEYTFRLSDSGSKLAQQDLRFFINGDRGKGRVWTVNIYQDGNKIQTLTKKTNSEGNVDFHDSFAADDDADIRVYAEVGYGETCRRTLSLD